MDSDKANAMVAAGAAGSKDGRPCLNVPQCYPFSVDIDAGVTRLDLSQSVDSDADFWWRGWKFVDTGAAYLMLVRFRLLNQYYLSNDLWPMVHQNLRGMTPEIKIAASGFIGIEATNNDAVTRKLRINFFGVKRYYLDLK
jgi:hypothetical protein